jgi:hypothetical protein
MPKKRMDVNWKREIGKEYLKPAVKRYRRYLKDKGLRESTIHMYLLHVSKYLEFSETDSPSADDFARFRDILYDKKLSRSTINNYSFSIKKYHEMLGQLSFAFIKPNNTITYYFDESEIMKIFYVRGGKGSKDALVFITDDCAKTLRQCSKLIDPSLLIRRFSAIP